MWNWQMGRMFGSLVLVLALVTGAQAAEKKGDTKLKVGEEAPGFALKDVRTGEEVSLADFRGKKTVVLTFQSLACPWNYMRENAGYERVLFPLSEEMASKDVVFLSINSNYDETVEVLKGYVEKHNMPYPLLKDPGNEVADAYGAQTTPHFYIIDKEGVLRYQGGYEQTPTNPEACGNMDEQYLVPAINAVLSGEEPEQTVTRSKGCTIKRVG